MPSHNVCSFVWYVNKGIRASQKNPQYSCLVQKERKHSRSAAREETDCLIGSKKKLFIFIVMNRKTEVKVKFFDFLIMLQLSFAFRLPECSRPIIAAFPCILFCVVVFLIVESFLFCVQLWCCGMCQATVAWRFVSISFYVSRLSMDSIASSAFFIF